jgi:PAS domain S-box-containing protein
MESSDRGLSVRVGVVGGGQTGSSVSEVLRGVQELRFETTLLSSVEELLPLVAGHAVDLVVLCRDGSTPAPPPADLSALRRLGVPTVCIVPEVDRVARGSAVREGGELSFCLDEVRSSLFSVGLLHLIEQRRRQLQRKRLETLLECAPSHILTVDPLGVIGYINHTLPPFTRDQVIGSSWLGFVPEGMRASTKQMLDRVLTTGSSEIYETATQGLDGGKLYFSCHIGPIRDGDEIVGAVVIAQDVTERRRAVDDLLAAQRLAAVGTLAAGIAHEINTPIQFVSDSLVFLRESSQETFALINALDGLYQRVTDGLATDDALAACAQATATADIEYLRENVPSAFERCTDGLKRVATIVRSLKEFAHPSDREMSPVDLNRAILNTLTIARSEYKYVADLDTQFGELPPVTCHVDEINQVVLNLVVNAAHAIQAVVQGSADKGRISLRTALAGGDVLIEVSDTGTGIPSDVMPRIFDPFFTTKEIGKGTGQGLAIARTIVKEHHGGDIAVHTRLGEGTKFSIRLPITPAKATASRASHGPAPEAAAR